MIDLGGAGYLAGGRGGFLSSLHLLRTPPAVGVRYGVPRPHPTDKVPYGGGGIKSLELSSLDRVGSVARAPAN